MNEQNKPSQTESPFPKAPLPLSGSGRKWSEQAKKVLDSAVVTRENFWVPKALRKVKA